MLDVLAWTGGAQSREEKLLEQVHGSGIPLPWQPTCHSSGDHSRKTYSSAHNEWLEWVIVYSLLWSQFRKADKCLPNCLQDQKQKWIFQWSVYNMSREQLLKEKIKRLRIIFSSWLLVSVLKHFSTTIHTWLTIWDFNVFSGFAPF